MTAVYFGRAVTRFGDYSWMFIADAVLALLAAYGQPARARSAPGGRRHGLNNCRYARCTLMTMTLLAL